MRAHIADQKRLAIRRRAMKGWLTAHGVTFPERARYNESALRKLVRTELAKATGNAA